MSANVTRCEPLAIQEYTSGCLARMRNGRVFWSVTIDAQDAAGAWIAAHATDPNTPGWYVFPEGTVDVNTGLKCIRVGAAMEEDDFSGLNWIAWADTSSSAYFQPLPWNNKDRVHRSFKTYRVPMYHDFSPTPKPLYNSAGDRFIVEQELTNPYLRIQRARLPGSFSYSTAQSCIGSINQAAITIKAVTGNITIPAEEAILRSVVAEDEIAGDGSGTAYFEILLEIECKGQYPPTATDTDGVVAKFKHILLPDWGYHYYGTANTPSTKTLALNPDGSDAVVEVPLNADGTKVTLTGTRATDEATLATKFRAFQRAPVKDWSSFII